MRSCRQRNEPRTVLPGVLLCLDLGRALRVPSTNLQTREVVSELFDHTLCDRLHLSMLPFWKAFAEEQPNLARWIVSPHPSAFIENRVEQSKQIWRSVEEVTNHQIKVPGPVLYRIEYIGMERHGAKIVLAGEEHQPVRLNVELQEIRLKVVAGHHQRIDGDLRRWAPQSCC